MTFKPKKRHKNHQIFILWFTQHAKTRQRMNAMDRLAKIEDLGLSGSWTEGITPRLYIDDRNFGGGRSSRPEERSPDVVRKPSDVEVYNFRFDFQKESP